MLGIILASHGGFAEGIKESAQMIFGDQEKLEAVVLKPSMGPDEYRKDLEAAIDRIDSEEVLFLCDLWGGTPFNQCSALIDGKEDKWSIVAGLNLPMLIEALSERFAESSAHKVAETIMASAVDGVKAKPDTIKRPGMKTSDESKEEIKAPKAAIPEGTVLGDGEIDIGLARVDTRLLHGQVATNWTKSINPDRIIIVCDIVCRDELRRNMIVEAAPPGVKVHVIPIKKMKKIQDDPRFGSTRAMLLFQNPQAVLMFLEMGGRLDSVNLGSMAHSEGKVVVTNAIAMDKEDVKTLEKIRSMGVDFDIRKVPGDSPESYDKAISKAKKELKMA